MRRRPFQRPREESGSAREAFARAASSAGSGGSEREEAEAEWRRRLR
jgi:hypothetical protein